jgi:hypothetical protein
VELNRPGPQPRLKAVQRRIRERNVWPLGQPPRRADQRIDIAAMYLARMGWEDLIQTIHQIARVVGKLGVHHGLPRR